MYQVNDMIVYGGYGVCRITATDVREIAGTTMDRDYYAIRPVEEGSENSVIFTPEEGGKVPMRSVMSAEEAHSLMREVPDIKPLQVASYKEREKMYRDIVKGVDNRALVSLLKTLYRSRAHNVSRKPNYADGQYFRRAERILMGELSVALHLPRSEAFSYWLKAVEPSKAQ